MFDYKKIKREHSKATNKVLSEPIMIFDFLELKEALFGVFLFFYFGIVDTKPLLLLGLLFVLVFVWPPFREKVPRGYLNHKISRFTPIKIRNFVGVNGRTKLKV